MKKRIFIVLIIALSLSSVTFCTLWQRALYDKSDLEVIAQTEANEAYRRFLDFQENGDDCDYWGGVSAFYAFQRAYSLLTEDTSKTTNNTFCNEVYGSLLCSPERSKAHISDIIDVMKILS